MQFLSLVGLYQKPVGVGKLASGVYWNTQPTDLPLGARAYDIDQAGNAGIYELARMSGTASVGSLVYYTGTTVLSGYVCCSGTGGLKPAGILMFSPTASGSWTFIQKWGRNTSVQITSTFSVAYPSVALYTDGGSACINQSAAVSGALIGSGGVGVYHYVGQNLTAATGSQTVGFINLL